MRILTIIAAGLFVAQSASAQTGSGTLDDWRRAMGCEAHISKLADENERAYRSFVAAARRDPKLRDQVADIERTEEANVKAKRVFASSARAGADALMAAGYQGWRAADPSLPAQDELVRREEAAARKAAAKPKNVLQLSAAIDGLRCESILAPTG